MDDWIRLGRLIKYYRRRKGWTQEALAQHMNMNRPSIANIESGRNAPTLAHFMELAVVLEVEPTLLLPTRENMRRIMYDEYTALKAQFQIFEDE